MKFLFFNFGSWKFFQVLDDFHLDGQAVHQQAASFRISESDPLGEFSMFRFSLINMFSKQHMFCNHLSLEVPLLHHLHVQVHCSGCSAPTPGPTTRSAAPPRKAGRTSPLFSHKWAEFFSQREGSFFTNGQVFCSQDEYFLLTSWQGFFYPSTDHSLAD